MLNECGPNQHILQWITCYLSDREQYVVVDIIEKKKKEKKGGRPCAKHLNVPMDPSSRPIAEFSVEMGYKSPSACTPVVKCLSTYAMMHC